MRKFNALVKLINNNDTYKENAPKIQSFIEKLTNTEVIEIVENIGTIPECIMASSTSEKSFSKVSDIVAARAFQELNFKAIAIDGRGSTADVTVESIERNYSFVLDAKTHRLSRTAKNQKDSKIDSLGNSWRGNNNYAVLLAPFFHYPNTKSQMFEQSLLQNVLLFSWEHLAILLKKSIIETETFSLEQVWNYPLKCKLKTQNSDLQINYFCDFNQYFAEEIKVDLDEIKSQMGNQISNLKRRAKADTAHLKTVEKDINEFGKDKLITELIKSKKINEKKKTIEKFAGGLDNANDRYFKLQQN